MNGGDLTMPTPTQTCEQEYSDLTASNRRPSKPYSRNTPQSFSRGNRSSAFEVHKACVHIFCILPSFLKICWRVKSCYDRDANRAGYGPALVKLFCSIFSQSTWQRKYSLFEYSQTSSLAAQKALASHMRSACLRPLY